MTQYINVDITHVRNGEWYAYVPSFDLGATASSEDKVRYSIYRLIEESQGLHSFVVIWRTV